MIRANTFAFGLALAGLLAIPIPSALASPVISTIDGLYGVNMYDTPELEISNTSGYTFTNVMLTLTGYQGENNGITQSQALPDITSAGLNYFWTGPTVAGNLFAYDYDDTGGNSQAGNPLCVQGYPFCAYVGNFYVTFTATLSGTGPMNGDSIYAQFSPGEDPLGIGNAACPTDGPNCFVGWEGLDPNGLAETTYDDHSTGGPNGVLANIYEGTPPPVGVTPEPSSLALLGTGLAGLAGMMRRKLAM